MTMRSQRLRNRRQPLPAYLARHLRDDRHLSDEVIVATSHAEAQRLLNAWYSRDRGG
ncbi:MAG TPA: hypothetical protein VIG44_09405 [Thermomicrobiales bacterium]